MIPWGTVRNTRLVFVPIPGREREKNPGTFYVIRAITVKGESFAVCNEALPATPAFVSKVSLESP